MSTRHVFAMIVLVCTLSQVGCVCMRNGGCGWGACAGPSCGLAAPCAGDPCCGLADTCDGCPSCGVADSCTDCPSCGVADASCGCPDGCGSAVTGRTPVVGQCRILACIRNALCGGCSGCGGKPYYGDWCESPSSACESCDNYGNYTGGNIGGPYASPHGRRAQMAKRNFNFEEELRFSEEGATTYR